jgi:hypothetical protein
MTGYDPPCNKRASLIPTIVAAGVPGGTSALELAEVVERAGIRLLLATTLAEGVRQRDRLPVRRVL